MTSPTPRQLTAPEARSAPGRAPLPEKALEVLDAARRVVDRDGADGLTMRAVSQEAGIPSSLTMYYFGSMAQLEALLLDSLWRDEVTQHLRHLEAPPATVAARVELLVNFHLQIAENSAGFRAYSELVAHVLRDRETQQSLAEIYEMYRTELNVPLLRSREQPFTSSQAYAAIMLAAGEGLPIGRLFGATDASMRAGFRLLSELLVAELEGARLAPATAAAPAAGPPTAADHDDAGSAAGASGAPDASSDAAPRNATARKLLDAGAKLLHRGGLRTLTFSAISEASGEAKSLVSYHFKSKQGFVDALARTLLEEWSVEVRHALIDQREITADTLSAQLFGNHSPLVSLILLQPALRHRAELQQFANTTYARTIEALAARFPTERGHGNAETSAALFMAALNGLALQSRYDPEGFDLTAALDALLRLLPPQHSGPSSRR